VKKELTEKRDEYRIERDPLGEVAVPRGALFGAQTQRALDNFRISSLRIDHSLIIAIAEIKKAAAIANLASHQLTPEIANAIIHAAGEVITGEWRDQFDLDAFQAGAGTSYNMNVNEVIANRALELLGFGRGDYSRLHPNDHVNRSQSTNDVIPTAMRIALIRSVRKLSPAAHSLCASLEKKGGEFGDVIKAGRTHLHDATSMTLGQEFKGYAANLLRSLKRIEDCEETLTEVPLGGTAIGTGVNTHGDFPARVVAALGEISALPLREAPNRIQSQQSLGDFLALSAALRGFAVELNKIANDLRLLDSGPHTGLAEISLPAVQPGSSIMPGKVNPSILETANMACFHIIGHDLAIAMAAEAGQLELNVMMPYVAYALLESLDVLRRTIATVDEKCVRGIEADRERCREYAERSVGQAATLNEKIGFMAAAELAKKAIETGKTVEQLVAEQEDGDLRSPPVI
jgi:aspartate ammonia-lyase